MKIGQYLAKIWTRVLCLPFLTHSVQIGCTISASNLVLSVVLVLVWLNTDYWVLNTEYFQLIWCCEIWYVFLGVLAVKPFYFYAVCKLFLTIVRKVLRIRSECRKRKLASVCVESVLNIQGNVLAIAASVIIFYRNTCLTPHCNNLREIFIQFLIIDRSYILLATSLSEIVRNNFCHWQGRCEN